MSDTRGASGFSGPTGAQDPSMEEILASIRRILAEEQDGSKFLEEPEAELLLDSSMRVPLPDEAPSTMVESPPPAAEPPEPAEEDTTPTMVMLETPAEPDEEPIMEEQIQRPEGLTNEQVTSQVVNSVGSLLRSIGTDRAVAIGRQGITLEDMVREELRPMLKAWLDTHLSGLVERVVRTEINRLMDIAQT